MTISRMQQPRQMYQEGGIMPRLNQLGSGVSSAEQMLQGINQRLESAESSLGGGGEETFELAGGYTTTQPPINLTQITDAQDKTLPGIPNGPGPRKIGGDSGSTINSFNSTPFPRGFGNLTDAYNPNHSYNINEIINPRGPRMDSTPMSQAMRSTFADGGMMGRQNYGLGSLVKSITKGVKSAIKGVTGAVKDNPLLAMAALNFAPMIGGGNPFIGLGSLAGGKFKGSLANIPNIASTLGLGVKEGAKPTLGQMAKVFSIGSLGGTGLAALEAAGVEDPSQVRDVEALKIQLANGYKLLNPEAEEDEVDAFVQANTAEYRADGGRIGYAMGSAEDNAMQASGIMGLPLNENPAGVTELDLRETGGFIPPVGVKEKADDIPAMLSNNEFVFTADAVRGMGNGDVNKGAERMYAMMKKLENGGRV